MTPLVLTLKLWPVFRVRSVTPPMSSVDIFPIPVAPARVTAPVVTILSVASFTASFIVLALLTPMSPVPAFNTPRFNASPLVTRISPKAPAPPSVVILSAPTVLLELPLAVPNDTSSAVPGVPLLTLSALVTTISPTVATSLAEVSVVTVAEPVVNASAVLRPTSPAPVTFSVMVPDVAVSAASSVVASTLALPVVTVPAPLIPVTAVRSILPDVAVVTPAASATVALPVVRLLFSVIEPVVAVIAIPPDAVPEAVTSAVVIAPSTVTLVVPLRVTLDPAPAVVMLPTVTSVPLTVTSAPAPFVTTPPT